VFGVACDRRAFFCQPKTRGLLFFNGEPCILLDGTNRTHAGIVADNALDAIGELIAIKGLAFEDFNNTVQLTGGTNHVLQGNQFGASISFSSTILASNDIPILLASDGTSIGGLAASHANLITGAIKNDISIGVGSYVASDNNVILGNQIGYDSSGIANTASSNSIGILVSGTDNQIVGNRLAGNRSRGITLFSAKRNARPPARFSIKPSGANPVRNHTNI